MTQIAFITGSSRGIGKAIAIKLASQGYTVVIHGTKNNDNLQITERELKIISKNVHSTFFDVTDPCEVDTKITEVLKKVGEISILINNAGIIKDRTLINMSDQEWDQVIKTNLYGPFFVTRKILPFMQKNMYGRIVNISSIIAMKGNFGQTNYAASKAGLIGMTKSLAQEVAKYNITVNAICPGLIDTDMTKGIPNQYIAKLLEKVSLKRQGSGEEIAEVVSFLTSNNSSYITGAAIDINGGWL